jgi:hypothetical protein
MIPVIKADNTIFKHKWVALFAFLIFMALSAEMINYVRFVDGASPNFFETILEQANEPQMILFPFMYVLFLFSINEKEEIGNEKTPFQLLKISSLASAQLIIFFVSANLVYCLLVIDTNSIFKNVWSYAGVLSNTHLSPLGAASLSLLFLFMRFSFLLYLMRFVNILTRKNHWGFWSAFAISYIDYMFYELLAIPNPLGVLPLEHTRIVYTEAFVPDFEHTAVRIPYFISILYWIGLIAAIYFALVLVYKRRRRDEKNLYR